MQLRFSFLGIFNIYETDYGKSYRLFGILIAKKWAFKAYDNECIGRGFFKNERRK